MFSAENKRIILGSVLYLQRSQCPQEIKPCLNLFFFFIKACPQIASLEHNGSTKKYPISQILGSWKDFCFILIQFLIHLYHLICLVVDTHFDVKSYSEEKKKPTILLDIHKQESPIYHCMDNYVLKLGTIKMLN